MLIDCLLRNGRSVIIRRRRALSLWNIAVGSYVSTGSNRLSATKGAGVKALDDDISLENRGKGHSSPSWPVRCGKPPACACRGPSSSQRLHVSVNAKRRVRGQGRTARRIPAFCAVFPEDRSQEHRPWLRTRNLAKEHRDKTLIVGDA